MQFQHIVVGLDFKSPSLNAAAFALRRLQPSKVTFAHILESDPAAGDSLLRASDALARLRETAATLGVPDAEVDVVSGVVGEELSLLAADLGADLVCVGAPPPDGASSHTLDEAALAAMGISVLRVPRTPAAGCVHAVWQGIGPGAEILSIANTIADAWGEDVNALCYLTEREWTRSGADGVEQRHLAQILQHAQVAGVEAVHVDTLHDARSVVRSIVSFVATYGEGLIVCDDETARAIDASERHSLPDGLAIPSALGRCPLLRVRGRRPAAVPPGQSYQASPATTKNSHHRRSESSSVPGGDGPFDGGSAA